MPAADGPLRGGTRAEGRVKVQGHACEELEETAKLFLLLEGKRIRPLNPQQRRVLLHTP